MEVGDLVKVKDDAHDAFLVGHIGVVMETGCFPDWEWMGSSTCIKVFICGAVEKILLEDLQKVYTMRDLEIV